MVAQINKLPTITSDSAKSLTEALAASGYDEAGKAAILQAIDTGLTSNIINTPKNQKGGVNGWASNYLWEGQTNYYTEQDWAGLLSSTKPLMNKVQIIVDRFMSLGITCPDEWTIAWATAILVRCHFRVFPKYKAVFDLVGDFKEAVRSCKKPWPFSFIANYPTIPQELPANVFAHAYDPDDQPVAKQLGRLKQTALNHIPLRKHNKLLIEEATAAKSAAAGVITYGTDQPCMAQICKMLHDQQEKMWSAMQNVLQDRASTSRDTHVPSPPKLPALTDYVEQHSEACLKSLAPSSLRSAKFIKPSLAIEDKVPGTGPGPVAGDLRLEPKADPDGFENQAVEPEAHEQAVVKAGATADAAAPSTEPQLTDFEKRMFSAMAKRTAKKMKSRGKKPVQSRRGQQQLLLSMISAASHIAQLSMEQPITTKARSIPT